MEENEILKEVLDQITNMWDCNYDEGSLEESFEGWCEDGEVFANKRSIQLMKEIAPAVDKLTYLLQDKWEELKNEEFNKGVKACKELIGENFSINGIRNKLNSIFNAHGEMFYADSCYIYKLDYNRYVYVYYNEEREKDKPLCITDIKGKIE